jgi:Zn-dependent protease
MKIPITVQPTFWIFAGLIGWLNSGTLQGILIWVGIIFVSVFFHELGHALMSIWFGQKPSIRLIAFGGVTSFEGPALKRWQQFFVVLNGPLFGFYLFLVATWMLSYEWSHYPMAFAILRLAQIANLFWTVVNLFPVLPLDGGQLLRIVLEGWLGEKGMSASLIVGAALSTLFGLGFLFLQQYLAGVFFLLFAVQNFSLWTNKRG